MLQRPTRLADQEFTLRLRRRSISAVKTIKNLIVDKADKKSVCFFMVYYRRPELTRMSMWHMAKVIKKFTEAGHECCGIVIGNEPEQAEYCESLGLEHLEHGNADLSKKFEFAWKEAMKKETSYICWLGSNNVNSDDFWDKALEKVNGQAVVSFGSKNFTIVDLNKENQKTMAWTRRSFHLCSCGQFFYRYTLAKTVNFSTVFQKTKNKEARTDFDGSMNQTIANRWGKESFEALESDPLDCIDVKSDVDIHPFKRYETGTYPQHYSRDEIFEKFEELKMLEDGYFNRL